MTQHSDGIYGAAEAPALQDVDQSILELVQPVRTAGVERTADTLAAATRGVDGLGRLVKSWAEAEPLPAVELNRVERRGGRPWLIPGWLPDGRLAMLTGAGGVGKTFLALGMAAAAGNGGGPIMPKPDYVTTIPPPICGGPVVYLSWEDEAEEAARRLQDVEKAHGLGPGALGQGVHYLYAAGLGPLWAPGQQSSWSISALAELTAAGRRVRAFCESKRARLLVLDPVAAVRSLLTIEIVDEDGRARSSKPKPCGPRLASHKSSYGPTPRPLWLERHDRAHPNRRPEDTGGVWFAADELQEQGAGTSLEEEPYDPGA